ncbi:MAG: SH3 domain-containing protein [Treponema sp.]|nr:SH3 domain-containing protein [Treponema sp.]
MKKILFFIAMIACTSFIYAKPKKMYVSAEKINLKSSTSFFAKQLEALDYGQQVLVLETKGKWSKVQPVENTEISGWISSSLLSKRKLISSFNNFSATTDELALAGKGFSSSDNWGKSNANYNAVKQIEGQIISNEELLKFIKEGELKNE